MWRSIKTMKSSKNQNAIIKPSDNFIDKANKVMANFKSVVQTRYLHSKQAVYYATLYTYVRARIDTLLAVIT